MKFIQITILLFVYGFSFAQKINTDLTYLVNPSKAKSNPPVLILLHGYGSSEGDLIEVAKTLDERFLTFSLRAPFKGKDVGYSWYELNFARNNEITSNYTELKESKAKILSFISNACKTYKADSAKVFLMGFSQGAIMAYDIALTNPTKIAGILALSGKMLEDTKTAKAETTSVAKLKFFIAHGKSDNVINIKEAEKATAFLKTNNIKEVTYKDYEMPHTLSGAELNDIKVWLKKQIAPPEKAKK
ncbi:MAG: dienelactone hydrolase family protein [Bacteroidota bacterium]|nr:dienelactone hydrolase family protein [Bacteroidota bacterium]